MDLREKRSGHDRRHPWELSRIRALKEILANETCTGCRVVLDVGCGDGFVSRELHKMSRSLSITGVDTYLSNGQLAELCSQSPEIRYINDYRHLRERHYDLILMLDVIEHVEDDRGFVLEVSNRYMAPEGCALVTAPAFQSLYGPHDTFLKHYRRYERKQLLDILKSANLECISSGYLFVSLLPMRLLSVSVQRVLGRTKGIERGVGAWTGGRMLTRACERFLAVDNRCAIYLAGRGITIPGLTVWALCKKRRS